MPFNRGMKKEDYDVYTAKSLKLLFIVFSLFLFLLIYIETGHKKKISNQITSIERVVNYKINKFEIREEANINYQLEIDSEIEELMRQILKEIEL